jgi:long-chain acyl-CoA synthetase
VVARLIREVKPETGPLDPSMTLELDLGFDSLSRVELLGQAENQLGMDIDTDRAARIFTLADLIEALSSSKTAGTAAGHSWKEMLEVPPGDPLTNHYIQSSRTFLNPVMFVAMRTLQLVSKVGFGLRHYGAEKLPRSLPFIICPNHESFLDGPVLISTLPRRIIYNIFILGYSDYWRNAFSKWLAEICNIVSIDPNANLVGAMQVAAAGLKSNRVLLVFPEGTRSIDGRVAEFRKGAAILAYELGIPIVPVGIRGTFEAWPRAGRFRFHPVEIHYGEAIDPGAFHNFADPYGAITERLRNDVKILAGEA